MARSKQVEASAPVRRGRPPRVPYSEALAREFFELMVAGHDLTECCDLLNVPRSTVYDWQAEHEDFRALCARGREALADFDARRIRDEINTTTDENANAKRVRIAGLQWFAERRAPRLYGSKTQTEITGANGGAIQTEHTQKIDVSGLDADQRANLRELLMAVKPVNALPKP